MDGADGHWQRILKTRMANVEWTQSRESLVSECGTGWSLVTDFGSAEVIHRSR